MRIPDDSEVNQFIQSHPDGATLEEIAAFTDTSRQNISNLYSRATKKAIKLFLTRYGIDKAWLTD